MIIIYFFMIIMVFIMKYMHKTKPPMNGIFTPNISGVLISVSVFSVFSKLLIIHYVLCIKSGSSLHNL